MSSTTPEGDSWVDGTYEAGADEAQPQVDEVPGQEGGAGIGELDDANTFEPEEADPDGSADPG